MTLTDDLRVMARGPLGCRAERAEGCLYGFLDREDAEVSGFQDLPRTVSRLDRLVVFRVPTEDLGTLARQDTLTIPAQSSHPRATEYRVQDLREDDDGLVTKLFLVAVSR